MTECVSCLLPVTAAHHERRREPFSARPPSITEGVVWPFRPGASWTRWWESRSRWARPSKSWAAACRGWRGGGCVPNAGTGGGEAGEEDATCRGSPLLHVLLLETRVPKSRPSSAHTMQTWKGRGKWTNAWSTHVKSTHEAVFCFKNDTLQINRGQHQ